jgi:hypothetical protein
MKRVFLTLRSKVCYVSRVKGRGCKDSKRGTRFTCHLGEAHSTATPDIVGLLCLDHTKSVAKTGSCSKMQTLVRFKNIIQM